MNKLKSMVLCGAMALCVTACGTSPEQELKQEYGLLQDQYAALQEEVAELESYRDSLKDMVEQEDKPAYVITFEVSQSHLTRRQLKYKANWYKKVIVTVDRFFPSSQLCSVCGAQWSGTKNLAVRKWTCPTCGAVHIRDVNAAKNILNEGLRLLLV